MRPSTAEQAAPNDEPLGPEPVSGPPAMKLWNALLAELPAAGSSDGSHHCREEPIARVASQPPAELPGWDQPMDPVPADLLLLMEPGM